MSFADIKGQEKAVELLKAHIRLQRLRGAYLFVGPRGVGKMLTAMALAKAMNCLNQEIDFCNSCTSCLKIEKGIHPDVHVIDAEGAEIKIEYIRQLQKDTFLLPYEGKKKVFIVRDAHNLNIPSANALLKSLEEVPDNSLIILITEKPALLLKTVISRCKIIKFSVLSRLELERALREDFSAEDSVAHYLAFACEGSIGRALERIKSSDVLSKKNAIIDAFCGMRRGHSIEQAALNREEIRAQLNILATWLRDLYLVKIGARRTELIHADRREELLKTGPRVTFSDLHEMLCSVSEALLYLEQNVNTKLLLSHVQWALKR